MIKILSALIGNPTENCFILTYNLDLPFFESALFEPLYSSGCRNTIVFCDPMQYQVSIEDAGMVNYAGQRYLLFPGKTSPHGAFHPKIVLQTSKMEGHLYIASANVSRSGYTNNWEVLTKFEFYEEKPDDISWQAFYWAYKLVRKIADESDPSGLIHERLDRLWETIPWLRNENQSKEIRNVWCLDNVDNTLLDQIHTKYLENDGSKVGDVFIISPYFD